MTYKIYTITLFNLKTPYMELLQKIIMTRLAYTLISSKSYLVDNQKRLIF